MSKNVSEILGTSMAKVREMVDANTIVGEPICAGEGITLIPISKITFGLASGGADFASKNAAANFGGGAGCGVKISPVAMICIQGERVRMLPITEPATTAAERIIEQLPELIDRFSEMIGEFKAKKDELAEI